MTQLSSEIASARAPDLRAWLEEEILEGRLRPGDRLNEQEICRSFGVSRTPFREALLQLASVGLVMFRPRQGAIVTRMSIKQIVAMWEALTGLERLCAELGARRMNAEQHRALTLIHERARSHVAEGDVAGYDQANREFHEAIYSGCRNEFLAQHTRDLRRRLRVYRRYPFERPGGMEHSFAGHQAVLDAVLAGDVQTAMDAMGEHLVGGLSFLDFIAELPEPVVEDDRRDVVSIR